MNTILIRVGIALFVRWLKKGQDAEKNFLVTSLFAARNRGELIALLSHDSTEEAIMEIVDDIKDETVSNVLKDLIGGRYALSVYKNETRGQTSILV